MRILVLSNIVPYRIGGAEVQARLLAECFGRRGHKVTIAGYAVPNGRLKLSQCTGGSIDLVHLPTFQRNRFTRAVSFFGSLARFLIVSGRQYDLIYCRMIGESALVSAFLKQLKVLRIPLVTCSEGKGAVGDAAFLKSLPARALIVRLLNRQCQAINVLSPEIKSELLDLGLDKRRFTYIPNGVPLPQMHRAGPAPVRRVGSSLFVGRLVPVKGVANLLRAVRILKAERVFLQVNIVGDGPLGDVLRKLAKALDVDTLVTFHGMIAPENVPGYYRTNSFLILPSYDEGFSIVVAEAMSYGMPVVVTRSGGPEHMADAETGLVCSTGNPKALAAAMASMLHMPPSRLIQMGQSARQRIRRRYDIEQVAGRLLSLFEQLSRDA